MRGDLAQAQRQAKEVHHLGVAQGDVMWQYFGSSLTETHTT